MGANKKQQKIKLIGALSLTDAVFNQFDLVHSQVPKGKIRDDATVIKQLLSEFRINLQIAVSAMDDV